MADNGHPVDEEARQGQLPDFVVAGAMKSGTTSLYTILRQHPNVYMPPLEVGFFDIDDIKQHPDFFKLRRGQWHYHSFSHDRMRLLAWYRGLFDGAAPGQLKGERSTTYMASEVAPRRMAELLPEVRIIFMLRDPVRRAYSNYWHLLRTGEATASFEKTLRYRHSVLFDRGIYRRQIERYLEFFPRDQILFLVFEEYVEDPLSTLRTVCDFLEIDADRFSETVTDRHENRGRYPWSSRLQYVVNTLLFHGLLDGHRYLDAHLPALRFEALDYGPVARRVFHGLVFFFKVLARLNCSRSSKPAMKTTTRGLLRDLYEDRNSGLSELIGRDLSNWWPDTKV